jgi:hypothetical protein
MEVSMRKQDGNDPQRLLPLSEIKNLGLGVESLRELERLFQLYPPAPPILKIGGRNFIIAAERDAFRDRLIGQALQEAYGRKQSPSPINRAGALEMEAAAKT